MLKDVVVRAREFWYVVMIGGLISLMAAGGVLFLMPPTYEATRNLLFVPSPRSENPREPVNPFFSYMTDGLATSISIVSIILNDERTQEQVAPEGSGIDYTAGPAMETTAPVLEIIATADSMLAADAAADRLVETANATLITQQESAGAPERTWIRTSLISSTIEPERVWSKPARFAAIVLAVGLLSTFWLVAHLWRRRHEGSAAGLPDRPASLDDVPVPADEVSVPPARDTAAIP